MSVTDASPDPLSGLSAGERVKIDQLIPPARVAHIALISAMVDRGMLPAIGQVDRCAAQQHEAQAAGTTSVHQDISWHELDRAVDYRARLPDGTMDKTTHNEAFFRALSEESGKIDGLRSLAYNTDGSKKLLNGKTWDAGHVEFRWPFDTLAQAVEAERPDLLA